MILRSLHCFSLDHTTSCPTGKKWIVDSLIMMSWLKKKKKKTLISHHNNSETLFRAKVCHNSKRDTEQYKFEVLPWRMEVMKQFPMDGHPTPLKPFHYNNLRAYLLQTPQLLPPLTQVSLFHSNKRVGDLACQCIPASVPANTVPSLSQELKHLLSSV